jgi:hydroxymethylbilane synthase
VIRLGTRGSTLALAQAREVAAALGGADVEIVPMRTEGDRLADTRLAVVGGKGLFVREIEEALLRGDIDVAAHSLKDLPAEAPAGLTLGAFPAREDAGDVLVARRPATVMTLAMGARVGTSSPRGRCCSRCVPTSPWSRSGATWTRGCASSAPGTGTRSCWPPPACAGSG